MRALTHFSLLAIAFLVAARPRAIERRYAVSRPGEETHSFEAAVSVPEDIVKRHPEAQPKEVGPSFSLSNPAPWLLKARAPEAKSKTVVASSSIVGTSPRDIGKRLPEVELKAGEPFAAADWAPDAILRRSAKAEPKVVERSFAAMEPLQRLAPRYSKIKTESEFHLYYRG